MNKISTELIVVIAAIAVFYLRIAMLRGQKKRFERELALKRRKVKGRSKGSPLPQQPKGTPPYTVRSWFLVVVSIILMLAGVVVYNEFYILKWQILQNTGAYTPYWYIPISVGVILLAFAIGIRKPVMEVDEKDE